MKILVTGGAGFIGSHLCERLVTQRHSVTAVDNFDSFYSPNRKRRNVASLRNNSRFSLLHCDVRSESGMHGIFARNRFDIVYHLAGRGGIPQSTRDPYEYLNEILLGTMVTLQCAVQHGVEVFINASSSSVYGRRSCQPSSERANTDRPLSIYAALKKSSELVCHSYHVLHGISVANIRFFSVYGPRGRPDQIVYKLAYMIDHGIPIPSVVPAPCRDFTYIDDIVTGLASILRLKRKFYAVINMGYGRMVEISQVIECLEKLLGKKAVHGDVVKRLESDAPSTQAKSALAGSRLNWRPKIDYKEGIKRFVNWYQTESRRRFFRDITINPTR